MADVTFKYTRFDPELTEFHAIAEQAAEAVGYTAELSVDSKLAELLRLRAAQIDECSYCLILHTKAAHDRGIHPAKIAHLPSWRESTMFSDDERAALAYGEALSLYDEPGLAAAHEALAERFDEKQIAEIAAIVINMNMWTRLKLAAGQVPVLEEKED